MIQRMRKMWGAIAVLAVGVLGLTGCGGTGAGASMPSPTVTAKPTTYYGETASALAALIPGCTGVTPGDVGNGAASGLASMASCVLNGMTVDIQSWSDAASADMGPLLQANKTEVYYAAGTGWTAFVRDTQLQMQMTNDAAGLAAAGPSAAADLPGEQSTAKTVADALGGTVKHYQP